MRTNWFAAIAVGILTLSVFSFAAEGDAVESLDEASATISEAVEAPASALILEAEIRPSYSVEADDYVYLDNTIEAGYKLSDKLSLSYAQGFQMNLFDSKDEASTDDFQLDVGFFRAKIKDMWSSADGAWKLDSQIRAYTPTNEGLRDAGMVTTLRGYLNLTRQFTDTFSITLSEVPQFYIYDQAGYSADGVATANPAIENRVYLTASYDISEKLNLAVPFFFHMTRYSDFQAGAAHNADWEYLLYSWPELTYKVDDNFNVGLAYKTGNFIADEGSISDGLTKGEIQTFVQFAL